MKFLTIIGARPQFVKAAVISRVMKDYPQIEEVIVHTGQHFDENMSDIFFEEMEIPKPDYNLNINGLNHGAMTGQMLEKIEEVLLKEQPDWVLVYGDTNSTLAGALAAKKMHIKLAHIEAGLRSFNMQMPEEINRILTDRMSDFLFCPTHQAMENLAKEGFEHFPCKIMNVGDVMQDAAVFYRSKAQKPQVEIPNHFILATVHRAENTDDFAKLKNIFDALEKLAEQHDLVLPLHPRTKQKLQQIHFDFERSNITFINPVGYLEMIYLLKNCKLVMTDSGGLQKEAYFFRKPAVTLREETEWVELVQHGFNKIAGSDKVQIIENAEVMLSKTDFNFDLNLYGNGMAGKMIAEAILKH
jgi:UDP-GlcNAc3NAcA epimerase